MRKEMMCRIALLVGVCFVTGAEASVLFQDDLDGTPDVDIVGTIPEVGGTTWTGGGLQPGGQILFAPGGGVQDVGPNGRSTNTWANSSLLAPFAFSALPAGEVVHLHVTMANISSTPATNPLESSRVDLVTNSSPPASITLGEVDDPTFDPAKSNLGYWGANTYAGSPITSSVTTMQSGLFVLDLYLDPNDAFRDGPTPNAILTVNGGSFARGTIVGLSSATSISEVALVRNIDDEVFFRGLTLETVCAPLAVLLGVTEQPRSGTVDRATTYPNPFKNATGVRFSLAEARNVDVDVYDVAGRLLRKLQSGRMEAGAHYVPWDGFDSDARRTKAGVYFMRVQSAERILSTKVVRMK